MTDMRRNLLFLAISAAVVVCGAAAGLVFGERAIPESERDLVLRASRIVGNLLEWLPADESAPDIVYDGIEGMLEVLDPHSSFLDPRTFERMRARQEGSFFGVGIIISRREGKVTVIAPMAGTPAAAKGLRAGDVISAVGGESTDELTLDEVVDLVRGPEGTPVALTIERPGLAEPLEFEITRTRIPTNSVRFAFLIDDRTGYLRLSEFSNTSTREIEEAVERLTAEGMQDLILDLRNNPGGTLDAAVGVSDVFLAPGQSIVSTSGRTPDSISSYESPGHRVRFEGPMVVVVNTGSASASEILAGAVQDHDRGLVLGEVTWGKGLVQTVYSIRDTGLALSTARYFTPSGRCIQRDYESYIDYITHRNGVSGPEMADQIYETDAGRTVLGGGGIIPDVTVETRERAEGLVRLYGQSAFFRFAVELLKDVPEDQQEAFGTSFECTSGVLSRFLAFVLSNEILAEDDVDELRLDEQALDDIRREVRVEVCNATLGLEAGYRVAVEGDEQLQAALAHLPEAEDIWKAWRDNHAPGG